MPTLFILTEFFMVGIKQATSLLIWQLNFAACSLDPKQYKQVITTYKYN